MAAGKRSLLSRLLALVLGLVLSAAVILGAIYAFLYFKYKINLFSTISSLKALNSPVNENTLYVDKFSDDDMAQAMTDINSSSINLVNYSEEDGYTIGTELAGPMLTDIKLTGKETGAVLNTLINSQEEAPAIDIGSAKLGISLVQVSFSNVQDRSVDANVVIKLDMSGLKSKMTSFPTKLLKKYVPNTLYISTTATITKGEEKFDYTISYKSIKLNKLTTKKTKEVIQVLNLVTKCGDEQQLGLSISTPFINAIIGNSESNGFAYSLKSLGAKDYNFVMESDTVYFVIKNLI